MTDRRLLGFVWLLLTLVVSTVFIDGTLWAFTTFDIPNSKILGTIDVSAVVGGGLGVGASAGLWFFQRVHAFCMEVVAETRKVVWPAPGEVRDSTVVVVVTSVLLALILGFFDLIWAKLSNLLLYRGA